MIEAPGKIAVLMGGTSSERDISLLSGSAVLRSLQEQGIDAHAVDPKIQPLWNLAQHGFQTAFIMLHGRPGEDGSVQGALELMGIPYTGSGVMASALALDKVRSKMIWQSCNLPTPAYCALSPDMADTVTYSSLAQKLGQRFIVKPARQGSSLGVASVTSQDELSQALNSAFALDSVVLAEAFIAGRELTCAILGKQTLPLIEIEAPAGYDYQNKYFTDAVHYHCPADLPDDLAKCIAQCALRAFTTLGCEGWGRADLMLTPQGEFFLLEMNTIPGMTDHSLMPMAARAYGLSFAALTKTILAGAHYG